jgi:trimeric autotransporter adhesin
MTRLKEGQNNKGKSKMKRSNIAFATILLLGCFALSPMARALNPPPDGGYFNETTAEGDGALFSLTTGFGNTALGFKALNSDTTGQLNTATGRNALLNNTTGDNNTADGSGALSSNTTGNFNTATGRLALLSNTTGNGNTASGFFSLGNNTTAERNTANGVAALFNNTTGENNIALGFGAGDNLTTGDNNIDIGNLGVATESNTVRIGEQVTVTDPNTGDTMPAHTRTFIAGISGAPVAGAAVKVNANGQLGVAPSSERFKAEIKPMDKASEAIFAFKPVTFRYKKELDAEGIPQFGLVAEQVEKVNPDLVVRDAKGKVYTVRYDAVNAMLLNEFLKEHQKVKKLEADLAAVNERLKEQDAKIYKVNAKVELTKPAPQMVNNSQ